MATPIGNLADITLRAIHVLSLMDAVACEDTRVGGALLRHLGLDKPLLAVHAHNEHEGAVRVVERLGQGHRLAFVSDAGTPALSDPGAVLVAAVVAAGHRVLPLPGPSSVLAALSVAGDVRGAGFAFVGFLPAKGQERRTALQALISNRQTQVLFEAPHRIADLLGALAEAAPLRRLTIARELTKQFEEVATLGAAAAPAWLAADGHRSRGEFALVLHAQAAPEASPGLGAQAELTLVTLLAELPLKQAVALAATLTGTSRNALYQRALALKQGLPPPG